MSRILLMAGGTGGHVFPALAVAEQLRARGHEVYWLGTRRGIEARLVPAAQIPLEFIQVEGVRGRGVMGLLKAPFLLTLALWQSLAISRRIQPQVLVGFGGFASGPGGIAAWLSRKPLLIHEQNAIAGTTNRWLARIATEVLTGFSDVLTNAQHLGNPVRASIEQLPAPVQRWQEREDQPLRILVLGGSLGAQALNTLLPDALARLPASMAVEVKHQCGAAHAEKAAALYAKAQVPVQLHSFIDDMAQAYGWADVVICRAGALTISELMAAGVGALLIPLPNAIDDHQTCNAAVLAGAGAALSVPQRDLTAEKLASLLTDELSDRQTLLQMANRARQLHRPEAALRVAERIEEYLSD